MFGLVLAAAVAVSGMPLAAPGTSLEAAVVKDGKLVYSFQAGDARAHTRFGVGSVTKMFTAVSIMQLVDAHKLNLNDPIERFFPGFPHGKEITVAQLLQHRSGIPNYLDQAVTDGSVYAPTTPQAIVLDAAKKQLDFAPGTRWHYSNTGYVMLGLIVERITRQPLAAYERMHIFAPLGMNDTANGFSSGTLVAPMIGSVRLEQPQSAWYYACGDIVSTASDLARFDQALLAGRLVSKTSFTSLSSVISKDTLSSGWDDGSGFFSRSLDGVALLGHHGGLPGYVADNELVPSQHMAFVVLSNNFNFQTDTALRPMLDTFAGGHTVAEVHAAGTGPFDQAQAMERFLDVFDQLQAGKLKDEGFSKTFRSGLAAQIGSVAQAFTALGTLQKLTFGKATTGSEGTLYSFGVTFGETLHQGVMAVDKDGIVTGYYIK